jgi:hypothetical protein
VTAEDRTRNSEFEDSVPDNRQRGHDEVGLLPGQYQDARGVDRSLIRYCLRLTPTQRMAENDSALALQASVRQPRPSPQTAGLVLADSPTDLPESHGTR